MIVTIFKAGWTCAIDDGRRTIGSALCFCHHVCILDHNRSHIEFCLAIKIHYSKFSFIIPLLSVSLGGLFKVQFFVIFINKWRASKTEQRSTKSWQQIIQVQNFKFVAALRNKLNSMSFKLHNRFAVHFEPLTSLLVFLSRFEMTWKKMVQLGTKKYFSKTSYV